MEREFIIKASTSGAIDSMMANAFQAMKIDVGTAFRADEVLNPRCRTSGHARRAAGRVLPAPKEVSHQPDDTAASRWRP